MSLDTTHMFRHATSGDKSAILDLAVATGLFEASELGKVDGMLGEYFNGALADHQWIVDDEDGVRSVAYFAPEIMTDGTWNLYFIGVHPDLQGTGRGSALLAHVEDELRARHQRLLLVETSGLENFEATRDFYRKNGFREEARIRDFYRAGDDKVIFCKALVT